MPLLCLSFYLFSFLLVFHDKFKGLDVIHVFVLATKGTYNTNSALYTSLVKVKVKRKIYAKKPLAVSASSQRVEVKYFHKWKALS